MAPKIERVVENIELGEGPHWDIASQSLYFVDIFSKTINKYDPSKKKHTKAHFDTYVSFIIPVEGEKNKFVVGLGRHIVFVTWDGESETVEEMKMLSEVDHQSPESMENRLNDAKCDTTGRLWAGTMGVEKINGNVKPNMGSFYSYSDRKLKKHFNQIGISNGLAWSKDNKKLFYIDSMKGTVDQLDFDITNGEISNRRTLFTFGESQKGGLPDGMTIDEDENLWVACFNGYQIIKIDSKTPETLLDTISLPAKQVTSVAWGGANLDELYVTSAKFLVDGVVLNPPDHGSIYKITGLGTKGLPMSNFKI
ncbi:regucalcin-like [Harmonia axyridis]|uniref:regucalcin-like n=1 Tax=Harmonia axyridis TaxID=115357 RepID=UPI001E277433|nr:regucalcin-like [Harmonia axyridis]XP_045470495.1 regucalcin-like [Harmonia axyridis]XP_045470496.1 regucalcin-like [Harmonia axyridis]